MALVITIDSGTELMDVFKQYGREDNFSPAGMRVLFEYLGNLSEETQQDIRLDVIALCCDYDENTTEDIIASFNIDVTDRMGEVIEDEDEIKEIVRDYLNDRTTVCGETGASFVYAIF